MASNNKKKTSQSQMRGTEKKREAAKQAAAKKQKKNIVYGTISVILIIAIVVLWFMLPKEGDEPTGGNNATIGSYYEEGKEYYADIIIEDYGTITVKLDAEAAPITVENFVNLASSGFYDGLTFHRIIYGFMMQGGSTDGLGYEGSSTNIYGEFLENGWDKNDISHDRGVISMARATDPNSANSQFFIMHFPTESLDGKYAAFGYVTEGMDVVDEICSTAQPSDGNGAIPAEYQPVIKTIKIYTED